jgi:hypothetical protein
MSTTWQASPTSPRGRHDIQDPWLRIHNASPTYIPLFARVTFANVMGHMTMLVDLRRTPMMAGA